MADKEVESFFRDKMTQMQGAPPAGPGESSLDAKEFFNRKRAELEHGRQRAGTISEEHARHSFPVGPLVGAAGGFAVGGPVGAIIGAGVGEVGQQAYDYATNSGYAPRDVESGAVRAIEEMGSAAIAEGGGAALRFFRPPKYAAPRVLTPEQKQMLDVRGKYSIPTSPDEITGTTTHRLMRAISEASVFSGRTWDEWSKNQNRAIRGALEGVVDGVAERASPQELGQLYVSFIKDTTRDIHRQMIDPLYNTIDQALQPRKVVKQMPSGRILPNPQGLVGPDGKVLTAPEMVNEEARDGGLLVNNTELKQMFSREIERTKDAGAAQGMVGKDLTQSPDYILKQKIAGLPEYSQWVDQHETLKIIRTKLADLNKPGVDTSQLPSRRVLQAAEAAMEAQLRRGLELSGDPEQRKLLQVWDRAQAYVQDVHNRMDAPVVQRLISKMEEKGGEPALKEFVKTISPKELDDAMKALEGNKALGLESNLPLRDKMFRAWLAVGIEEAGGYRDLDQPFNVKKFHDWIYGKTELSGGKDKVLLDRVPGLRQKLDELMNATLEQDRKSHKFGEVFIKMKQAGAFFAIPAAVSGMLGLEAYRDVSGGNYKEAAADAAGIITIVAGPSVLASLMHNKRAIEFMIQGMRYSIPNATKTVGDGTVYNEVAGKFIQAGGKEVPTNYAQMARVLRELMRADENFARLIQAGVSSQINTPERAAESFTDLRTRASQLMDQAQGGLRQFAPQ